MIMNKMVLATKARRGAQLRSLRKWAMAVSAPLAVLACVPAATGVLTLIYMFSPCGDTPGFCPY
jgi:hypothetical protein